MANSIVNTAEREIVETNKISFALVHGSGKAVLSWRLFPAELN
jgi:hypothetical protein